MVFKCTDSDDGSCGRKFDPIFEHRYSAALTNTWSVALRC